MLKKYLILSLILASILDVQASFYWNKNCQEAYTEIFQLKFTKGKQLLEVEKKKNPNNLLPYFIENYIDYLTIQIGEEIEEFKNLEKNKHLRIEKIKDGDPTSPWLLYTQAEIHLQWAANRMKFNEYVTAAIEINKAYRLLIQNKKNYPKFTPNLKSLGTIHALIGSIPKKYNWILEIIGMQGSINDGINEIKTLIDFAKEKQEYRFLLDESYFIYSFLKMNLQNDISGMEEILKDIKSSDNLLLNFAASRLASKLGKNDLAIKILEERNQTQDHYPFLYLEYLLGVYKQNKLSSESIYHFTKYIKEFKGKNYIKSTYLKMSWQKLIEGDTLEFVLAQNNINYHGDILVDADKEAQLVFENKVTPQIDLLKARLYFDGGYYKKALSILDNIKNIDYFSNTNHITEYFYRKGRIYDALNNIVLAKKNYSKTIDLTIKNSSYFTSKSALQLALISEKEKDYIKAKYYFNKCLSIENHQYKQSIDQKAQAGLNRIQNL